MDSFEASPDHFKVIESVIHTESFRELSDEFNDVAGFEMSPRFRVLFHEIWIVLTKIENSAFTEIEKRSKYNEKKTFYEMINGIVQEKFAAVEYHYMNYSEVETSAIGAAIRLARLFPRPKFSHTMGFTCRRLDFEMEAFFLQTSACLDTFARSVGYYFEASSRGSIFKLRKYLSLNRRQNVKAQRIVQIIDKYATLLGELETIGGKVSKRDTIAHVGHLRVRPLHVIQSASGEIRILPQLETEHDSPALSEASQSDLLREKMERIFEFIAEIYDIIFDLPHLRHG